MVGSAILKNLEQKGYSNFILRTHKELDLTDQQAVKAFFEAEKPEYVFLAAAKVGGIVANNTYRADFIYANLMIQNNVIHQAYLNGVKKLLFLGSTCIYPRDCPQPMKEEYLLTGPLEYTNEPYAIAKIAGIRMCESYNIQYGTNFIAVQPTNLYGPNDNFDLEKSHVLPALIRKVHLGKALENADWETIRKDLNKLPIEGVDGQAPETEILNILSKYGIKFSPNENSEIKNQKSKITVEIWGSGKPMREFLWSEDMADACVYLMETIDFKDIVTLNSSQQNIATGQKEHDKIPPPSGGGVRYQRTEGATHINIGTGREISIKELAETIRAIIGFMGDFYFNTEKPDGTLRKLTDPSKLTGLGWEYSVELVEGLRRMYMWYSE